MRDRHPQAVLQEAENVDFGAGLTSNFDIVTHPTAPTVNGYQGSAEGGPSDGGGVGGGGSGGGVGSSDGEKQTRDLSKCSMMILNSF